MAGALPKPLVVLWNGSKWTDKSVPVPVKELYSSATAVSCMSPTLCFVVGVSYPPLAWTWSGSAWSWTTLPIPVGSNGGLALSDIACLSTATTPAFCMAVGSYENTSGGTFPLSEAWDGTVWSIKASRNPTGASKTELDGVSCTSSTKCTAVGYSLPTRQTIIPLVERWNGSKWTSQLPANRPTSLGAQLEGVSCSQATECTAVGYRYGAHSSRESVTLAENWNGSAWAVQPTP